MSDETKVTDDKKVSSKIHDTLYTYSSSADMNKRLGFIRGLNNDYFADSLPLSEAPASAPETL